MIVHKLAEPVFKPKLPHLSGPISFQDMKLGHISSNGVTELATIVTYSN